MSNRIFATNRWLLTCAGAIISVGAIAQTNDVSAQVKVTNQKVLKNSATAKNTSKNTAKNTAPKPSVVTNRLPDSAKDLKAPVLLKFKPSSSIIISTKPDSDLIEVAQNNLKVAQSSPTSNSPFIKIAPISIKPSYSPGLNAGTPSGFGLQTGDGFIGLFGATAGKLRDTVDGSISLGAGLGDANKYFAVEGVFNINSIRRFAENGSFDLKVHKIVYSDAANQVGVAVGWTNFANYGGNAGGTPSSVYGVATLSHLTNPENADNPQTLVFSAGAGGGTYRKSDSNGGVGVFGSLGYLVDPQWGVSTAWSGQGLNFSVGFLPDRTLPLNINLTYSDITNNSDAGTQVILGVTYGFNYLGRR